MPVLLIEVHLLEPLWHGAVDWPPSPFRLFQALVAGAYGGRWVEEDDDAKKHRAEALQWLERQNPPDIAFPPRSRFRRVTSFVPNNDLDSVGGDLNKVPDIRAEKTLIPWRIENGDSFLYAWTFDQGSEHAQLICSLAERLYRFGRGLDGAWALARVLAAADAETLLRSRGAVSRPCAQSQPGLRCPAPDSLHSLVRHHEAAASRFKWDAATQKFLFRQPPKPIYRTISYDSPGTRLWFEIRQSANLGRFHPISQTQVVSLTEEVRDRAARRLLDAMPESRPQTERFLTGRSASPDDINRRIRIVALPSLGHQQTSPAIRRVGVLIPPDCPIPAADVAWAFSGLPISGLGTNTLDHALGVLVQTATPEMAYQYGFDCPAKRWRSVTPIALPQPIPYARLGSKRSEFETQAASAVVQACRHAGIVPRPAEIRVQVEPFLLRGEPAHTYAAERFSGRLRHAAITFERSVREPLLIGDGRFSASAFCNQSSTAAQVCTSFPWTVTVP
jgi:CRISPR-associated protein Csb2